MERLSNGSEQKSRKHLELWEKLDLFSITIWKLKILDWKKILSEKIWSSSLEILSLKVWWSDIQGKKRFKLIPFNSTSDWLIGTESDWPTAPSINSFQGRIFQNSCKHVNRKWSAWVCCQSMVYNLEKGWDQRKHCYWKSRKNL